MTTLSDFQQTCRVFGVRIHGPICGRYFVFVHGRLITHLFKSLSETVPFVLSLTRMN